MDKTITIRNTRESWLDVIRIIACLMVIMMHATIQPSERGGLTNTFNALITYLMSPCNGLFFMVSGALLIKPRIIPMGSFLKKRLGRIIPPLLSWSIIYITLRFCLDKYEGGYTDALNAIIMMPFSAQGCGYFWFMYVLIGCYIMIPIWSAWMQYASRKALIFIILLWFSTSFIPLVLKVYPYFEEFNSWMYYFAGFMGYFLLGYYIRKYPYTASWRNIIIGTFFTILLLCLHLYVMPDMNPKGKLYCYLQPYVITACFTIFCCIFKFCKSLATFSIITRMSEATFGIYLSQSLILNYILKEADLIMSFPSISGFIIRVILTFVIGYIFVRVISYTPLKRFLTI